MTKFFRILLMMSALGLGACGGGSGGAPFGGGPVVTPPTGPGVTVPTAADLVLVLDATSVANNGNETVGATATAIDANRNAVVGVPVVISVNNNAIATPKTSVTDKDGKLIASLSIGADRTSRTITVTATSGTIVKTAQLQVQESGSNGTGPSDLLLILSSATIANNGNETVTANITALDAKRNVLPGVVASFTVDQGATVQASGTATGANGVLSAVLGIGASRVNRTIIVTANAGGITRTANLQVVDSPSVLNPTAADLSLSLSSSTLTNGGSSTILATATAVDINRNALAGIPITFSVDRSAVAAVSGPKTNAQGVVTASVGLGSDRSNRVITVTASSGTLTKAVSFSVIGAKLTASFAPLVVAGSTPNPVEYKLVDTNDSPMPGQTVSVLVPGLPNGSGTTDVNGKYTYSYTAPASAATLTFTATSAGDTNTQTVSVQPAGGGTVPAALELPRSASLTPSPSVISVNSVGSRNNQVELRALFLGTDNKPIKNVRVRFDLADNSNSSDGVTSWLGGDYAYSDASGVARGTFTPGQRSSPTNGVTVRACYDVGDFAITTPANCPVDKRVSATLTVVSEALSVNIRTNELIKEGAAKLTYIKEYVVMVVDAAGQAKPDVLITPSVDLPGYYKGYYVFNGKFWEQVLTLANTEQYAWDPVGRRWVKGAPKNEPVCPNEDVNRNGVREATVFNANVVAPALSAREEDLNWNGDLDPRKADVAIKMVGSARTDANGLAIVQIEYGKSVATWVDFVITVTASGISGTEARARYAGLRYGLGNLPASSESVTNENVAPAFVVSPYGKSSLVEVTPPTNPRTFIGSGVCTDNK